MRISDWSSDVCSSDLPCRSSSLWRRTIPRSRGRPPEDGTKTMTTRRRDIDLEEALEVVRDLLERHQRKHGYVPENVVVVGGTALAVHGVRERSLDVDVYIPDADDDIVAQSEEDGVLKYGPDFKLDVTPVDTLWGTLSIRDIDKSTIARRVSRSEERRVGKECVSTCRSR